MTHDHIYPDHQRVAAAWSDLPAAAQDRLIAAARRRRERPPLTSRDVSAALATVGVICAGAASPIVIVMTLAWSVGNPLVVVGAALLVGLGCLAVLVLRRQPDGMEP